MESYENIYIFPKNTGKGKMYKNFVQSAGRRIWKWITATRLRKFLSIILICLITLTSIRYLFLRPKIVLADSTFALNEGYGSSVNDNNGNVSAGTITGATWRTDELCYDNRCLYFDGSGDKVAFSDDPDLDFAAADDFTIVGWFRHPVITSNPDYVVTKHQSTVAGGYKIYMDSDGDMVFGVDDDGTWDTTDIVGDDQSKNFDDNKWHHFAAQKDGTTGIYLYVDGILIDQDTSLAETGSLANAASFHIGIDADGSSNSWSGFLDEVKVYRSLRTADEIKADYTGSTNSRGTSATFGGDQSYLSNGLVGYWKMDNNTGTTTTDSSGNASTATFYEGTTSATSGPTWTTGKYGPGVNFPGTDDVIRIPETTATDLGELTQSFTLSIWFNTTTGTSTTPNIFSKNDGVGGSYWGMYLNSSEQPSFVVSGGGSTSVGGSTALNDGVWHHVVAVRDVLQDKIYLYIDGVLVDEDTDNATASAANDDDISFGNASTSYNGLDFTGQLDEARIYNRALSPSEIANLYNWTPSPVAHYKMDENTGDDLNDSTGTISALLSFEGGSSQEWVPGKFGQAVRFNSNDNAQLASAGTALQIIGNLTISTWINIDSAISDGDNILSYRTNGPSTEADNNIYILRVDTSSGRDIEYEHMYGTNQSESVIFDANFNANTWYHISVVRNVSANTVKLFVNGVQTGSTFTYTNDPSGGSNSLLRVGNSSNPDSGAGYDGLIDDIRIYNYDRSASQIIEDMNGGHPAPGSPVGSALGYWKFDEGSDNRCSGGTNDACNSGSGGTTYDGAQNNMASPATATSGWTNSGKFTKALKFDGTNDFVQVSGLMGTPANVTLSAWVNLTTADSNGAEVISIGDYIDLRADDTNSTGGVSTGFWDGSAPWNNAFTGVNIAGTGWRHLAVVFDDTNNTQKIYIDGKVRGSSSFTESISYSTLGTDTLIGKHANGSTLYDFNGTIDEVKVYNLALTADQIKAEYNRGSSVVMGAVSTDSSGNASWSSEYEYCPPGQGSSCTPPVAEWRMDENTGTTLNDSSGNGNTSTTWMNNTSYTNGKNGSGLFFDGVNDGVRIVESATTDLGGTSDSYSISAWFKIDVNIATDQAIVYKRKDGSNTYPFSLFVAGSTDAVTIVLSDGTNVCTSNSGLNTVIDGKWHHATGVWDTSSNTTAVYLDGVLVDIDSGCAATGSFANDHDISIGNGRTTADGDYTQHDFQGYIDQVRIYNYARTSPQIAWEYNHGLPTISWWKLDDNVSGNGATINDSTIWGRSGTTVNGGSGLDCTIAAKRNLGCDLDGSNDNINVGNQNIHNSAFLDFHDFSVSGWFNRDTFTTDDTIIGKKPSQAADDGWLFWIDADTDKLTFIAADGVDTYTVESASTFTSTGWNHFTLTWDDDTEANINMYINGIAESVTKTGTLSAIGNMFGNARNLRIGIEHDATDNPFDGKVDDLRIYGHVLNAIEAKNLYATSSNSMFFGPASGNP